MNTFSALLPNPKWVRLYAAAFRSDGAARALPMWVILMVLVLAAVPTVVEGQIEFEKPPINYAEATSHDPVSKLQNMLEAGTVQLEYDADHGYLPSVLKLLNIKPSSQVLVFSKTSFQLQRITPKRPRAVYFNDESYVGWVQHGDVVEVMTTDPQLGAVFYTVSQDRDDPPRFVRDRGQCLTCHASSRTQGVPGGLVRSVFTGLSGQPEFGSGTFTTDHCSPFAERWGGWYVTGTHGPMRHMGNVVARDRQNPEMLDREAGANLKDLKDHLDVTPYLAPHSDIVSLMVLEHQTQMHNLLTRASYENRIAAHYDGIMNAALERPSDFVSDTARRRVAAVGDKLLQYLLFTDEFQLEAPVTGTSAFVNEFQALGPRDSQGRSLRDFDLKTRMFKYPCSYLIYSPAFDQLPDMVKRYVVTRLQDVLTGQDTSREFQHLSAGDRRAIHEILTATKPGLWARRAGFQPASSLLRRAGFQPASSLLREADSRIVRPPPGQARVVGVERGGMRWATPSS